MIRELLLAAGVLGIVTGCASSGTPGPGAPAASRWSPTRSHPPSSGASGASGPSGPSGPAGITSPEAARLAPLAPARLTAVTEAGVVRLAWPATGEDLAYYECLRRTAPGGEWRALERTPPTRRTCVDRAPVSGTYVYGVRAVAGNGLGSPITGSGAVVVP